MKTSKLYFYKEIDVEWGDFSQVEAELFLMKKVIASKNIYTYLHLIPGVDFPIKSNKEIYNFFNNNMGKNFIHYQSIDLPDYKYNLIKYYRFMKN